MPAVQTYDDVGAISTSLVDADQMRDASSATSFQPELAQSFQVLLVFSFALDKSTIQPCRDVENLEKLRIFGDR